MASGDGSVEITVTGSVDPSLAKATTEAKVEITGLSQAVDAVGKESEAAAAGVSALGAAEATVAKTTETMTAATTQTTAAVATETTAVVASTGAHVSSRAAREALVLVHEVLSGNYHRLAGSILIEAQAMAGAEATAKAFAAILTPMGGIIIGAGIAAIATAVAMVQYDASQRELTASTLGLGAASELTSDQIKAAATVAEDSSGQSKKAMTDSAEAFAAAGVRSQTQVATLSGMVQTYAELTGQKAAEAQKALATAMQDPVKGAQDLNAQLGILDDTQLRQIETMTEAGDKTGAVNVIMQALKERSDAANVAGVGVNSTWQSVKSTFSDLWTVMGEATSKMDEFAKVAMEVVALGPRAAMSLGQIDAEVKRAGETAAAAQQRMAADNIASAAAKPLQDATPEGRDNARRAELAGDIKKLQTAQGADKDLHNAAGYKADTEALAEYTRALKTFHGEAERGHIIAQLDAKIADAKHAHNEQLVQDLTKQKTLESLGGTVMSDSDANQKASDAGATARERNTPKAKAGPSAVSEWEQQLHQQEIASGEFFKDQTASELAFWEQKAGIAAKGSKDWLEVQARIYEARKKLAHDDYAEHLATLNDQIEADKDSWSKEAADWDTKLGYIKGKFGEESTEYKNAYREQEAAAREHQNEMDRAAKSAETKHLEELKKSLNEARKAREDDARASEAIVKSQGSTSPFGEVSADVQVGAIHHQLMAQELADLETLHAAQTQTEDADLARSLARYGQDSDQYRASLKAKADADAEYEAQKRELAARGRMQQIQDILAVQSAYSSYISSSVSATVSGFSKMIGGTGTFAQMGVSIYNSMVSQIEQQISRMVTNWIVQHLFMTAAQRAQIAMQTAQQATGEAGKTAAVVVGTEARVAATATGAAQSSAIVGLHNMKEITSHAAAAAAAAYHALAGIPIVGPVLGAAAAVATFAAVEAYGALASLDQGTNYVPNDMVAQIHAGERIIPAADNARLMDAMDGRGPKTGKQGTTLNYSPQLSGDTKPFAQQLLDHASDLKQMVGNMMRNGEM